MKRPAELLLVLAALLAGAGPAACGWPAGAARSSPAGTASAPPSPRPSAHASPSPLNAEWPEFMGGPARSGAGPAGPPATRVTQAWQAGLDGALYASPVAAGGMVFAATENDSVYGFDATSGRQLWHASLGTAVPGRSLPCGNIDPSGITSTPAIDPASGLLFVVGRTAEADGMHHRLWALDARTGDRRWQRDVDPAGADARNHQVRGALAVSQGRVYVPFGGLLGDCAQYRGALVSVPVSGQGDAVAYLVPTRREGGIWAPPGEVALPQGDLLVATGNGQSSTVFDHANAVIRLSPDLQERDYWAPSDWAQLSARDTDVGSTSPVLLPGGVVFQSGKNGLGYLLHLDHLGGIGGEAFSAPVCPNGVWGGVAATGNRLFVPCHGGVQELDVNGERFSAGWRGQGGGETPVVAYGWVWSVDRNHSRLFAFDAAGGQARGSWPLPDLVAHFTTPAVAGGRIYVGGGSALTAFSVT